MKVDKSKFDGWIKSKEHYLPSLSEIIAIPDTKLLVVGATVFEIYYLQDWIALPPRQTSDFDLSIGLVGDDSFYAAAKVILRLAGYKDDEMHPYRHHPPVKIPGGLQYIDLLAYPLGDSTGVDVPLKAMGVGDGFSLNGFKFASQNSYEIEQNLIFPNIFGMLILKIESYLDDPVKRIKDFADLLQLISGFVDKGKHFEMDVEWGMAKEAPDAKKIKECLQSIVKDTSPTWDIEDVRFELNRRNVTNEYIDTTMINQLKEFLIQLD